MSQASETDPNPSSRGLTVDLARRPRDVHEAQRLRFQVFSDERGARIGKAVGGLDVDRFDRFCDHLLVRTADGRLVGTTRVLTQERAVAAGGFYSETEFELGPILRQPGRFLEVGRTCVHPEHRNGAIIAVLWSGIAGLLQDYGYDRLMGCASICLTAGLGPVRALVRRVQEAHQTPDSLRAVPRLPLPNMSTRDHRPAPMPPLLKAYLRLGAEVCGDAAWDQDFRTADLLVLLHRQRLDLRYARHFLKAS